MFSSRGVRFCSFVAGAVASTASFAAVLTEQRTENFSGFPTSGTSSFRDNGPDAAGLTPVKEQNRVKLADGTTQLNDFGFSLTNNVNGGGTAGEMGGLIGRSNAAEPITGYYGLRTGNSNSSSLPALNTITTTPGANILTASADFRQGSNSAGNAGSFRFYFGYFNTAEPETGGDVANTNPGDFIGFRISGSSASIANPSLEARPTNGTGGGSTITTTVNAQTKSAFSFTLTRLGDVNGDTIGNDGATLAGTFNGVTASRTVSESDLALFTPDGFGIRNGNDRGLNGATTGLVFFDNLEYTAVAVPEPASLGLLGVGGLMMLRRRRA